jgi:CheY-like chemotaxis protein
LVERSRDPVSVMHMRREQRSSMSRRRVLLVDDHAPFRGVLRRMLQQRGDVVIVGEAIDGVDAIRQAEALRPDLILLDLGLPMLSGIEVAGRIRAALPDVKIVLLTDESSPEVVEHALQRGAHGYVYKARARRDLLRVLDGVDRGGRFIGGGLERIGRGDSLTSHRHDVLFWSSDAVLVNGLGRFIADALHAGSAVIVVVSDAHNESLHEHLRASHVRLDVAIREGRYVPLSVSDLLSTIMVNGWPDLERFRSAAAGIVAEAARHATRNDGKVAACGEGAATLWAQGHADAAIQLEHLWDDVSIGQQIDILCPYPVAVHDEHASDVRRLCAAHTAVEIR